MISTYGYFGNLKFYDKKQLDIMSVASLLNPRNIQRHKCCQVVEL